MKLTNLIFLLSDILMGLSKMQIRLYVNIISLIKKKTLSASGRTECTELR